VFLGSLVANADGAINGSLVVQSTVDLGAGVLQVNGIGTNGLVRSVSIGVNVRSAAMTTGTKIQTKVFFAAFSSNLSAADQRKLDAFIADIPKGATVSTLFMGYAGKNSANLERAAAIARNRAQATADYAVSAGLKGSVYVSGEGKSSASGKAGRKVIVKVTYQVPTRSTDFEPGELKTMLYR